MQWKFFEADITEYWDMWPSPCGWKKKKEVLLIFVNTCVLKKERKKKRNRLSQWFSENVNATSILVNSRNGCFLCCLYCSIALS